MSCCFCCKPVHLCPVKFCISPGKVGLMTKRKVGVEAGRVRASKLEPFGSPNFAERMERAWLISQQPRPVACSSCNYKGHVECKWCSGTGFFIIGDNMLCQVPSRNTTCVICSGKGCDASVLLQGNGTEKTDPANKSLDGFSVVDSAKRVLEVFCPGTVSCADILALAARDAVEFSGGPSIQIPTGRRDGLSSLAANVRPNIIDTSFTLNEMAKVFSSKGLSLDDLVALSGAHTIGSAHCNSFNERFKLDSNGKLTLIDKSLNGQYAAQLTKMCPAGTRDDSIKVSNDPGTPQQFDNRYYNNLLEQKGLFSSDSALLNDDRTSSKVAEFAKNQDSFFESWGASFLKLSTIGVKTDNEGEIRQTCSMING